jgi:hypothetical protein
MIRAFHRRRAPFQEILPRLRPRNVCLGEGGKHGQHCERCERCNLHDRHQFSFSDELDRHNNLYAH